MPLHSTDSKWDQSNNQAKRFDWNARFIDRHLRKFTAYKCRNILRAFHCRVLGGLIWKKINRADGGVELEGRLVGATSWPHFIIIVFGAIILYPASQCVAPNISHAYASVLSCLLPAFYIRQLGFFFFFECVSRRDLCCCRGERKRNIHFLILFFHTIFFLTLLHVGAPSRLHWPVAPLLFNECVHPSIFFYHV